MIDLEIGIDSFASATSLGENQQKLDHSTLIRQLVERIRLADQVGLDVFGIGEHHRKEFLDSAPTNILSAAALITKNIRLVTAVSVLSAADPVRVFQNHTTLDLLSNGRAEIVVGRGSFTDAFPLFGFDLQDYDALFREKLELLLAIQKNTVVNWQGTFRPPLKNQEVYPRPHQEFLPIWLGVGGTPQSFIRAGELGLPLMVAVIGGETHRFRPLIDLYRKTGIEAGHSPEKLKVGLHSLGYVADTYEQAEEDYFPGYAKSFTQIGKERGWRAVDRKHFQKQTTPKGAIVLGTPEQVAQKILQHSDALGGISRFTFQMDIADLPHSKLSNAIELIGKKVIPLLRNK
jgi:probable LLM family oxidoreductase